MEREILDLLSDDYYSLWEIRDVVSRQCGEYSLDHIKRVTIELVQQGIISCYVSSDLSRNDLQFVARSKGVDLLKDKENWLIPTNDSAQIVSLAIAETQ